MTRTTLAGAAAGALALSSLALANHIDLMNDGAFNLTGADSTVAFGSDDNILGGARFVSLDAVDASASLTAGGNAITFNTLGATAATLTLDYGDFPGGDPLNADFASQWDFVSVNITSAQGSGLITIELRDGSGAVGSLSLVASSTGIYNFQFDNPGYDGVDFTDIDRVTLTLDANPGADFSIGAITRGAIPAPGATTLAALTGLFTICRRRR